VESQALIHWPDPLLELAGFIGAFLATGAVGFRYTALGRLRALTVDDAPGRRAAAGAARLAAVLGLVGALAGLALFWHDLPEMAVRRHTEVRALLEHDTAVHLQVGFLLLIVLGDVLAWIGLEAGWPLAGAGVLGGALRGVVGGRWLRLVNPLHVLFGGLWIGTLLMLVVVGLPAVLRAPLPPGRRGATVAQMVAAFSPLALVSAGFLAVFGVITAWTHLKRLDALWTTPYGVTLIVKLCVVLCVVALGAWNWRRQRPRLGPDEAAALIGRSATAEVALAGIVLAITAILVSLPSPRG
jgi:uncharacterized membrane protein